ncbi:MAG: cytochrome ubiquinol oxidase subunit I, partial [Paraglaciecola sp.]|nr:cytochrome ubiquinol oxidase subunit I [Paraglaciecola sp.]
LGYEVLTAFFLEATFLGIMLFGINRVPPWVHTLATLIVAVGTTLSAFWIISLNSWMHTPAGFEMIDGVAHAVDWWAIIFNPSMPYRLLHVLLASGLTAAFLIAGISAYRISRGDDKKAPKLSLKSAVIVAAILIPIQILVGDQHGLNTLEHQPQKVAAMEAAWETQEGLPLVLFAVPDAKQKTNHFELAIPNGASLILTHELHGKVKGINEFEEHPPVAPVFYAFRVMLATGGLMLLISWFASFSVLRNKPLPKVLVKALIWMTFSGWLATIAGWYVTEIGRQPYLVSGILTTADAVTDIPSGNVLFSFIGYLVVYALLLVAYIKTIFRMARNSVLIEEIKLEERNAQKGFVPLTSQHTDSEVSV